MNTTCIQWRARFLKLLEELDSAPSYNTLKLHIATGAAMLKSHRASELDFRITAIVESAIDDAHQKDSTDITHIYVCEFRKPMSPRSKIRTMYIMFHRGPGLRPMISLEPAGSIYQSRDEIIKYVMSNIPTPSEPYANTFSRIMSSDLVARTIALYINN